MASNPFGRAGWTPDRVPDLTGQTFVVTGANSGIGYEACRVLAARGARMLWLCRNPAKAQAAEAELKREHPTAHVVHIVCDLADLESVRAAADAVREHTDALAALVNNAGIMMVPDRQLTAQGMELQLGVNHMAHFALTGWLLDLVEAGGQRIVSVSSGAHHPGRFDFDDLMWERGYGAIRAYTRSKLANLLFTHEANRRLPAAGRATRAYVGHPGYSATNLQTTGPGALLAGIMKIGNVVVAQSAERGSWPTLLAATDPAAEPGVYYGPTGPFEAFGKVGVCHPSRKALDEATAAQLWEASERWTGVAWP